MTYKQDHARRSMGYRKSHFAAVSELYGDAGPHIDYKPPKTRTMARRTHPLGEHTIQVKLVAWAKERGFTIHSIPNHGKRSIWAGKREVDMGLMKGAADLFLQHASAGFHGYYIELKTQGKKPRPEQIAFGEQARRNGYKWEWFDNFMLAQKSIMDYIDNISCG